MLAYLIEKFSQVVVQKDPFSYFHIKEIFPQSFYQEILEYFPKPEHFEPLSSKGVVRTGTYSQRYTLSLDEEGLSRLPFFYQVFWSRFSEMLKSDACLSAIQRIFNIERLDVLPDVSLVSDYTGYAIGPHTDHPQKILTLLFYLPKDHSQKELGTSIYKPADPKFKCEGYRHYSFEGFLKVYKAPFIPNSLFGFLKSDCSFHGVEPIGIQSVPRNSMSYQLMTYDRNSR